MQGGLSQERTKQRLVTKSGRVRNRPRHHPEGQWGCSGPLDWKEPPRVEGATNHPAACLPVCPPPSSLIGLSAQPSFPARKLRKCSSPLSFSFLHTWWGDEILQPCQGKTFSLCNIFNIYKVIIALDYRIDLIGNSGFFLDIYSNLRSTWCQKVGKTE